jgi:hypothetical protein
MASAVGREAINPVIFVNPLSEIQFTGNLYGTAKVAS